MKSTSRPMLASTLGAFGPSHLPVVAPGSVLDGRYQLMELIGQGGTAEVYRGVDQLLGRDIAVKVFDARLSDLNTAVR